jgi:predicted nucleotidyltransferase component of viral defense system
MVASVHQRLINLRDTYGEQFNALLTQYAVERFLYRLSQSEFADRFVLKGAMLFRVWSGKLHRPTRDLDLLGYGDSAPNAIADVVRRILALSVPEDGLVFDADSVVAEEIRERQEYGGIRVKLVVRLGKAAIPMQIDVGFGDAVTPEAQLQTYPTLLDQNAPQLRMYPPETVVAEKVQALVVLGMANTRMKDFYDLLVILRIYDLTEQHLASAIAATFARRETALPSEVPAGLSDHFAGDDHTQRLWSEFLRRLEIENAPDDFREVVGTIRDRVWSAVKHAQVLGRSGEA